MSVAITVSVGRAGAAADHARYICRERATQGEGERVWTQNVPEYVDRGDAEEISYKERVADLREFARQLEEDELAKPHHGRGETRTHYRAIYSFDRKVDDEKAKEMVNRHLAESFPKARVIAAIHRDTDNAHVHVQIAARDIDGKKLQFSQREFRSLDEKWARIYGREFGEEHAREHLRKKQETMAWKREAYRAKQEGREIGPKPERVAHLRNQVQERIRMAGKQYGTEKGRERDADERAVGRNQRRTIGGERQALPNDRADAGDVRRVERADRAPSLDAGSRSRHPAAARRADAYARADRAAGLVRDDAAIRADRVADGRSYQNDGAGPRPGRDEDRRSAEPPKQAGRNIETGLGREAGDARVTDGGPAHERELLGHARSERDAGAVDGRDFTLDRGADRGLRLPAGDSARHPDERGSRELADLHLRHDARTESAGYGRNPSEAGEDHRRTGFEPAGRGGAADEHHRAEHSRGIAAGGGATGPTTEQRQAAGQGTPALTPERQQQGVTGEELMRMMTEATAPVDLREAIEAADRRAAEQAKLAREAAERARELAERQAREQALAKIHQEKAFKLANRAAELKLHELVKEHGREILRDPQTVEHLGRAMEQTLAKEKTRLSEFGHTKESLREQIKTYVDGVARDPDSFTRRIEPERQQTRERSRNIEHDRGGYGYSR